MLTEQEAKELFSNWNAVCGYIAYKLGRQGTREKVEDLAAIAMENTVLNRGHIHNLRDYLFASAKRAIVNDWRRRVVEARRIERLSDRMRVEQQGGAEDFSWVGDLLGILDPPDKEIIRLRYLMFWSYGRLAVFYHIRPEAARARTFRAMQRLRRGLNGGSALKTTQWQCPPGCQCGKHRQQNRVASIYLLRRFQ